MIGRNLGRQRRQLNAGRKKGRVREKPWILCLRWTLVRISSKPLPCGDIQINGDGLN